VGRPSLQPFFQKLHKELGLLLIACDIIPAGVAKLKVVVQNVSEANLYKISDIGYKFGHTMDDDKLDE